MFLGGFQTLYITFSHKFGSVNSTDGHKCVIYEYKMLNYTNVSKQIRIVCQWYGSIMSFVRLLEPTRQGIVISKVDILIDRVPLRLNSTTVIGTHTVDVW